MSKKTDIIKATKDLIHVNGYQATTINHVLEAAEIGKGQFYHYFSSKRDLGLAVVEEVVRTWRQDLIISILQSGKKPKEKLNDMLNWVVSYQTPIESGCPIGNLALELSEHDEAFRGLVDAILQEWIEVLTSILNEMVQAGELEAEPDPKQYAQSLVAMIEGAILLRKSQKNIQVLLNITDVIRIQLKLSPVK